MALMAARPTEVSWGLQGSTHYLRLRGRTATGDLPPIIFCHSFTEDDWQPLLASLVGLSFHAWRRAGYTVYVPYTGDNWSSPVGGLTTGGTGLDAIDDMIAAAAAHGHPTDRVHLAGISMGGGNILSWAMTHPNQVGGVQCYVPVYDLGAMWDLVQYRPSIEAAWGVTGRANVVAASAAVDPVQNLGLLAAIADRVEVFADRVDASIGWDGLQELCWETGITLRASDPTGGYGHIAWPISPFLDDVDALRLFAGMGVSAVTDRTFGGFVSDITPVIDDVEYGDGATVIDYGGVFA